MRSDRASPVRAAHGRCDRIIVVLGPKSSRARPRGPRAQPCATSSVTLHESSTIAGSDTPELPALPAENARLRGLRGLDVGSVDLPPSGWTPTLFAEPDHAGADGVDRASPPAAKIALFRSRFAGRDDVDTLRWETNRSRKAGWGRRCVVGGRTFATRTVSCCRSRVR